MHHTSSNGPGQSDYIPEQKQLKKNKQQPRSHRSSDTRAKGQCKGQIFNLLQSVFTPIDGAKSNRLNASANVQYVHNEENWLQNKVCQRVIDYSKDLDSSKDLNSLLLSFLTVNNLCVCVCFTTVHYWAR